MVERVDTSGTGSIVVGRRTTDIDDEVRIDILNLWIDVLTEIVYALILQSHTIKHSLRCFDHTGIIVALSRRLCGSLYDDGAYLFQRHQVLELQAVTERSTGGHHGVGELQLIYSYI